ncbi:sodium/hydrogen exchanger 3-like isoform X2 [Xyrauchen texanus]|uniref:sodium/hydrogen exchanger 3-like isoform X2 n=1 Tax=Xyrauchen texanus TaxID=154827 RepID=UPI002241EADF|nr:sodium/hydrogen exchanger 3-like isoform X2 [Xyrauchen texanus]
MPSSTYLCLLRAVFLVCCVNPFIQGISADANQCEEPQHRLKPNLTEVPIVTFAWHHVQTPYLVMVWVFVSCLAKLSVIEINHHVTSMVPESGMLIILGFILGGIVWGADKMQTFKLLPYTFFFYLLPQIILDAGYFMPNKLFFSNLGAILVYAIIGTCWNAAAIGLSLWGCYEAGAMGNLDIGLLQFLLFGSLIAAVDPVAVIAVFEEVHVNDVLFILVFGESLLNDGVTVVLYNVFDAFVSIGGPMIDAAEIFKGISSFFVVAFGGSLLGVVFAILLSLLTRCTKNIQIIEAGFVFVLGYLAYLTADMLSLSAILSVTFCGICCQKYVNFNMDEKSVTTVRHTMKVLANGSETMIFVFLGITAIDEAIWVWNTGFILLTLLFVFIYRIIGVFFLTWILNKFRLVPIEVIDQVVMSYGGLRGAVAYGLAAMLDENKIKEKNLMISTTLIVVYFTVIIQGITMKPLVQWLKVKRAAHFDLKLVEKVNNRAFDHILSAVEDICGRIGDNWWTRNWKRFEEKYISRLLMKPKARKNKDDLFSIYHKLNLEDAMNYVSEGERQGSLAFIRSDKAANIDFKMQFGSKYPHVIPEIMVDMSNYEFGIENTSITSIVKDSVPSISLDIHGQDHKKLVDDHNAHHLLQQHLYRSRKHHRHKYSRYQFGINQSEDEVQEIFQRTMRGRLESFKSAKMGVHHAKKTKHSKKVSIGHPDDRGYPNGDEVDSAVVSETSATNGHFTRDTYIMGGIDNPAFMPDMGTPIQSPPWLMEPETDMAVAPSQRAQGRLPWTLNRLVPMRISNCSMDSFLIADASLTQNVHEEQPQRDDAEV